VLGSASIFVTLADTEGLAPGQVSEWWATGFNSQEAVLITAFPSRTHIEGEHGVSFSRSLAVEDVSIETRSEGGKITFIVWCTVRNTGNTHIPVYIINWAKVSP